MVRQDNRFVVLCPANAVKEQKRDVDNANNKGGCNLLLNRVYFALWGMVLSYTMQNGIEKCVFDCENGGSAHPKYKAVRLGEDIFKVLPSRAFPRRSTARHDKDAREEGRDGRRDGASEGGLRPP